MLLVLIAIVAVTGACQRTIRRTPDDTVVVLLEDIIRDIDPRFALTNHDTKLSRLVCPGLTTVDSPSLEPQMALAESITRKSDVVWEARLREGLVFSDGSPVRAADVVYTYESVMDPEMASVHQQGFSERIESVKAIDDRSVRFTLVKPVATLLSDLDFGIISEQAALRSGGRFEGGQVVGAGAFMVKEKEEERVLLVRNPNYFGEPAQSEKIEVRTVRDSNARTLMLVGGSADFTQNSIRIDLVDEVARRPRVKAVSGPGAILTYFMMQNEDPVLKDVRVRRAIAHAIDRERIIEAKLHGHAIPATGLLPTSHWAYNPDVPRYGYDPDRARALLDEAGFPDPDGPGGEPRLRLSYKTSANQFRLTLARVIASQLAEVGLEVEVRSFEFGTFFADIKRGNFQLASMQTSAITEPDYLYTYFHSERIPTPETPNLHNRWRYRGTKVDQWTARGREEMNRDTRRELYGEVQRQLAEDLPIIPLWHEDVIAVMNVDVDNYHVLPSARLGGLSAIRKNTK